MAEARTIGSTNALYQKQRLAVTGQNYRLRAALTKDFFLPLGQAYHRHIKMACPPDTLQCGTKLSLAAVNDNQIRHLGISCSVAPHGHFPHGLKVIRLSLGTPDFEAAIVGFFCRATFKDHHRGYGFRALIM